MSRANRSSEWHVLFRMSKALTDPTLAHPARTPRLKSAPKTSQPIKLGDGTELDRLADAACFICLAGAHIWIAIPKNA